MGGGDADFFEADIALVEKRFDDMSKTNVLSRPSIAGKDYLTRVRMYKIGRRTI